MKPIRPVFLEMVYSRLEQWNAFAVVWSIKMYNMLLCKKSKKDHVYNMYNLELYIWHYWIYFIKIIMVGKQLLHCFIKHKIIYNHNQNLSKCSIEILLLLLLPFLTSTLPTFGDYLPCSNTLSKSSWVRGVVGFKVRGKLSLIPSPIHSWFYFVIDNYFFVGVVKYHHR